MNPIYFFFTSPYAMYTMYVSRQQPSMFFTTVLFLFLF